MARKRFEGRFIRNTGGEWVATYYEGHLWDLRGDWIGWVEDNGDVYKSDGEWVGHLIDDNRIIRRRTDRRHTLREDIPEPPPKPDFPARAPLAPIFRELTYSEVDVMEEDPNVFKRLSDRKPDMK